MRTDDRGDFALGYHHTEHTGEGWRYSLPDRELGKFRWSGLAFLAAGRFALVFLTAWMLA